MKRRNLLIVGSAGSVADIGNLGASVEPPIGTARNEPGNGITIEQPGSSPASNAYLYFRINQQDVGDPKANRASMAEYINRRPMSAIWNIEQKTLQLVVSNGGATASDLIRVDYEVRYCTDPSHQANQGFSTVHANEQQGSTSSAMDTLDFVPAGDVAFVRVPLKALSALHSRIYVRARVVGMFAPATKPETWNFATDPAVIEAWKELQ